MKKRTVLICLVSLMFYLLPSCATQQITQEQCTKNSRVKLAVFTFQNDTYGAADEITHRYRASCFQVVERVDLSKKVSEMQLQSSGLTEYQQIEAGKIANIDFIVVGSAYTETKQHYQNPIANKNPIAAFVDGLERGLSGTYVYASIRVIDVKTARVIETNPKILIRKISY